MSQRTTRIDPKLKNPLYRFKQKERIGLRTLADRLGYKSVDGVVRLMRYANGPSLIVAQRIAEMIGSTTEAVLNDYARHLETLKHSRAA